MKSFVTILGVLFMLTAMILSGYISWSNPDVTERRLFIEHTNEYIGIVSLMIVGCWLFYFGVKPEN